jgi:hypothetical protein
MSAPLYRDHERSISARPQPAKPYSPAESYVYPGPWTAPPGEAAFDQEPPIPGFRHPWCRFLSSLGILLAALFLWWALIRGSLALIALFS